MPLLPVMYRAATAFAGNEPDARDLVQTVYLKALERFDRFENGTNCKGWMMQIMRNTWIDQLRRRRTAGPQVSLEADLLPAPDDRPDEVDLRELLEQFSDSAIIRVLQELPDSQRMALYLTDVEGLDQNEVAAILDIAVGTVKSRVSRARSVLREKLQAHARDMGFVGRRS
ncbi:MAG: ECF RNA polymerase sigma factor SigH [Planctomycetes bacterium ADurb.Bin126]|nr:MAG: ECF RNA polymerase sigma factor SigH [Planctomycetes bacterium ADurb.Bin126]